jgi:Xaa-Pro dipeptidase
MLKKELCRERQKRLSNVLSKAGLDGAIIGHREHVYYFTGYRAHWNHAPAAYLDSKGKLTVVGWNIAPETTAADEIVSYPAHKHSTMPPDQAAHCAAVLAKAVKIAGKIGIDGEGRSAIGRVASDAVDLTPQIMRLRKKKDQDELECLRGAIAITEKMYAHARATLAPGLDEIELYTQLRAVAIKTAGGEVECFGNDFRANAGGGAARNRAMQAGELYVLDAGPSLHGYHADNCRTFSVDRKPTDVQIKASKKIIDCLAMLEKNLKPGITGTKLYDLAKAFLSDAGHSGLCHHLGHGIGLQPHEAPQLNPEFPEAVLEAGDVITMEPGLYSDQLRAGIRLEQDYLITETGMERLTSFPLDL